MTNFEKIKAMSVEEMAEWICGIFDEDEYDGKYICGVTIIAYNENAIKKYLESEAEEDMLPEICSCGYRFETDETICPNCGKKVEEDG